MSQAFHDRAVFLSRPNNLRQILPRINLPCPAHACEAAYVDGLDYALAVYKVVAGEAAYEVAVGDLPFLV